MSDMKCPVCCKQMKIGMLDPDDSMGTVWISIMPCDCVCSYGASKAVWQELIRTRKALYIAIKRLGYIKNNYKSWTPDRDEQMIAQAANGLDEIKIALEQRGK